MDFEGMLSSEVQSSTSMVFSSMRQLKSSILKGHESDFYTVS
jgi:hypothetical protein